MDYTNLIPVSDCSNFPFPFFDDKSQEQWYKVYHDGGHYVATSISQAHCVSVSRKHENKDIDIMFDSLFKSAVQQGLNNYNKHKKNSVSREMTNYIKTGIEKLFPNYSDIDGYIEKKIKRKYHNLGVRKKRFRRKAYLNRWNYFVTFTFDDNKHTPDSFRKKLCKCLSNLHTRRGWRYMGVFEYAPETGRLHFHGLLYVPDGEMISKLTEKKDYSTAQGKMQITHSNEFFAKSFGRNDFEEISEMDIKHGHTLEYLLKYIEKQGERIVYSRGIATVVYKKLKATEIITNFVDYVKKYVLFDSTIDWEKDVMRFQAHQMSFIDIMCNPSMLA